MCTSLPTAGDTTDNCDGELEGIDRSLLRYPFGIYNTYLPTCIPYNRNSISKVDDTVKIEALTWRQVFELQIVVNTSSIHLSYCQGDG